MIILLAEFLNKPDTPRRIDDEGKSKRRISWGTKRMREFQNKEHNSDSNPSNQKDDDKTPGIRPKTFTIYGPEQIQSISPDIDIVPSRDTVNADNSDIQFDFLEENSYEKINSEERKRIEDEIYGFGNTIYENSNMEIEPPKKTIEETKRADSNKNGGSKRHIIEEVKQEKNSKPSKRQSIFVEKIKGRKSVAKMDEQFDPTRRFSTNSIFKENLSASEDLDEIDAQEDDFIQNKGTKDSEFLIASPPQNINEERKVETLDDSCSKFISEIQIKQQKDIENKEKLISLFNSIKSPKANKTKINEYTNSNITDKKKLNFESSEVEVEIKSLWREQIEEYNRLK